MALWQGGAAVPSAWVGALGWPQGGGPLSSSRAHHHSGPEPSCPPPSPAGLSLLRPSRLPSCPSGPRQAGQ